MSGERNLGVPKLEADETASVHINYESRLATARHPCLRKLSEYEQVCGRPVADRVSFFIGMPSSPESAKEMAGTLGDSLREFARYGVLPLIYVEPVTDKGRIAVNDFGSGQHDASFRTLFGQLRKQGITNEMMGMWVPFPEPNMPVWGNVRPGAVSDAITRFAALQKDQFSASRIAVLLNSMTFPHDDDWEGGAYKSLEPYVEHIPHGLVDSLGVQGFTWPANAPGAVAALDPAIFLQPDLAAAAARKLGVSEVWFNTGVFARSGRVAGQVHNLDPVQRIGILEGIIAQAEVVRSHGFRPAIHLFAEDKFDTAEKIDWSYWPQGQAADSAHTQVFKSFVGQLEDAQIPLWLFDHADSA